MFISSKVSWPISCINLKCFKSNRAWNFLWNSLGNWVTQRISILHNTYTLWSFFPGEFLFMFQHTLCYQRHFQWESAHSKNSAYRNLILIFFIKKYKRKESSLYLVLWWIKLTHYWIFIEKSLLKVKKSSHLSKIR